MEETPQTQNMNSCFTSLLNSKTPPKEFFNFKRTSIPQSWDIAQKRIIYNLEKFKTFYSCIALAFSFIFILFKPSVVLLIAICSLSVYANINTPTVQGFKFTRIITNSLTGIFIVIFSIFFNNVVVSILALLSLIGLGIITHAVTIEEDEITEDI